MNLTLPPERSLGRFVALSLALHLALLLLWLMALPQPVEPPQRFEVQWIDPQATRKEATKPAPKQAPPTKEAPAPAKKAAPAAPKPAPKPSLDLSPAPLGLAGGGLSLGGGELNPQGPSTRQLGRPGAPSTQAGLAAQVEPGSPKGIRAGSRGVEGSAREGGAPIRSKIQVKERPEQGGTAVQPGSAEGKGAIEGEVRGRPILFRPAAPALNIERDVTITLSFTVLPDGSVEAIVPLVKGEPSLEALAIDLLSRFRFEPINGTTAQRGVIHFKLQRQGR
ncbi:MAG: hypothetical protein RRB13_10110 [bacterium]|nr:hypothetical protein [bacterium]